MPILFHHFQPVIPPFADCTDDLRKIRKPAQEFLDENLLRSVPVKVTYTSREGFSALEHTNTLGGAGGSASLRLATLMSRVTSVPHGNATDRMNAIMKEIQEEAVFLQGLKRQSSPESAMRNLVTQALAELQTQGQPRYSRAAVLRQDQNPLVMHPVLDKFISMKEPREMGVDVSCNQVEGDVAAVDANIPSSKGTRAIA